MPSIGDIAVPYLAPFVIGLVALFIYLEHRKRIRRSAQPATSLGIADRDPDTILARDCKEFEKSVNLNPRDAFAWTGWGKALEGRAAGKPHAESARLYAQAEEKYSAALAITPDDVGLSARLAGVSLYRGTFLTGEDGRQCLARACDLCEQIVERSAGPRYNLALHRHALLTWGAALDWLGRRMGYPEADRLYAQAEEKYSAALKVDLHNKTPGSRDPGMLLSWAFRHPGEASRQLFMKVRDESERVLGMRPNDVTALTRWACSMLQLANREPDSEADELYAQVEERCRLGLAANPADENLVCTLANTLVQRAEMRQAEAGNEFLVEAGKLVEAAVLSHPEHEGLLSVWARVLNFRTMRMPGDETNRLIDEAVGQFDAARRSGPDPERLLWGWGALLWAQARRSEGAESVRFLEEARRAYLEAESRAPGSAAYDVACVSALLGDWEECRHWLRESREPGIRASSAWIARDPALASVRECDWFRQLLAG